MSVQLDLNAGWFTANFLKLDASNDPIVGDLLLKPTSNSTSTLLVEQSDGTDVFNVDTTNARVGIGTATPSTALHVKGAGPNEFTIQSNATGQSSDFGMQFVDDAGTQRHYIAETSVGSDSITFGSIVGDIIIRPKNTKSIIFSEASGDQRAILDSNHNFTVGASALAGRLNVLGDADMVQFLLKANATQTANLVEFQKSDGTPYVVVGPDVLSTGGTQSFLKIDGTLPSGGSSSVFGIKYNITTGGAGGPNNHRYGQYTGLLAGYTGSAATFSFAVDNFVAGTGSNWAGSLANFGFRALALGNTTGDNVGAAGKALGGNLNLGFGGTAQNNKANAVNIGVFGNAKNTASGGIHIGGYFILDDDPADPSTSAALIADNFDKTDPIFLGQDNGTTVFKVIDGGATTIDLVADLVGLTIQAHSSQNANILEMQDSNAAVLTFVTGDGDLIVGEATQQTNADKLQIGGGWTFKESSAPTADSGYGKIWTEDNNELFFQSGDGNTHLLHGDAFSNMWFHGLTRDVVEIATSNLFTLIDSFDVVGEEDDLTNVVANTTNNDMTVGVNAAGKYKLTFHTSITSSSAASEMLVCMGITLATPLNITGATNATPIVITSNGHGLEKGDMVTIDGCTGNTAADGDWFVSVADANTFTIVTMAGANSVGNGVYDSGSGDVDIKYPGNLLIHRKVSLNDLVGGGANADMNLNASDKVKMYVVNIGSTRDLEIAIINYEIFRIGD